ncbi:MAG: hypothetical protein OEV44_00810 [Spirochaetota bacterium]|nr:hypothetical protein [Spirochaetota bacterium]
MSLSCLLADLLPPHFEQLECGFFLGLFQVVTVLQSKQYLLLLSILYLIVYQHLIHRLLSCKGIR